MKRFFSGAGIFVGNTMLLYGLAGLHSSLFWIVAGIELLLISLPNKEAAP